jgi:two-component system OmpR family sensor kinase
MTVQRESSSETEFVSNLVHDLKTPLSAVKGFIELIQQSGPLNDQQMRFSNRALDGLERMGFMIANLLDFARVESGVPLELSECDLR